MYILSFKTQDKSIIELKKKKPRSKNLSGGLSLSPGYKWTVAVGRYNPKMENTYIDESSHEDP